MPTFPNLILYIPSMFMFWREGPTAVFHSCTRDVVGLPSVYQQTHAWLFRLNWEAKPNNNKVNFLSVQCGQFFFFYVHGAVFIKPLTPCKISGRCIQSRPGDAPGSRTEAEITLWLCLYERENFMRWETVCARDSVWSWPKMLMQCE